MEEIKLPEKKFGELPKELSTLKNSKFMILSIPYEQTTSYKCGTKEGPQAIIDASRYVELYDEELDKSPCDAGIHTLGELVSDNSGPEKMLNRIYDNVKNIIRKDKVLISLGGEHSITSGLVKAHKDHFPDFSVLQLDAHADLRDEYEGTIYSHACAMRRVIKYCPLVQVGIRNISAEEMSFYKSTDRTKIFFAKDINKNFDSYLEKIVDSLQDKVYITIDLDALDPSIMSSVGTPEPGGLGWYQTLDLLKLVCARKKVIGVDFVELLPHKENIAPDFLVAKLIYKLIGYMSDYRKKERRGN